MTTDMYTKAEDTGEHLDRMVTISRQDYERLYLTPKSASQGELRKVFGNPTPLYVERIASSKHLLHRIYSLTILPTGLAL
jgi:hypothetical protein